MEEIGNYDQNQYSRYIWNTLSAPLSSTNEGQLGKRHSLVMPITLYDCELECWGMLISSSETKECWGLNWSSLIRDKKLDKINLNCYQREKS